MATSLTITIDKKTKEVSCKSNTDLVSLQNINVHSFGTFYNQDGTVATADDIGKMYVKHETDLYNHLDGAGTVVVIDRIQNKIFAFTDYFNSILPLFYAQNKHQLMLSTNMLTLTREMSGLSISKVAARQFLLHGMVYGERTLIEKVRKLPAKHFLEIDINRCKVHCRKCRYTFDDVANIGIDEYNAIFEKCMEECYREDAGMTLSGGYDTNFILHYVQKIKNERADKALIQAYCGGGITGKDESPLAAEIAEYYGNMDLRTFKVGTTSIQHFPEIVLALQGSCFEDGIFLHYLLAKKLHADSIKYVYTGDLADQVLNLDSFKYSKTTYKRMLRTTYYGVKNAIVHKKYDYYNWMFRGRYEIGALKNLKKGGLLWDYFGVKGIYPYVRRRFLAVAKSVAVPGDYSKAFHRKAVLATVDSAIAQKIKRDGGNTDPIALFDERTKKVFKAEITKMPWYKDREFADENQQLGYELRVLFIDLVRRIFINQELAEYNVGEYPLLENLYPAFKKK